MLDAKILEDGSDLRGGYWLTGGVLNGVWCLVG